MKIVSNPLSFGGNYFLVHVESQLSSVV